MCAHSGGNADRLSSGDASSIESRRRLTAELLVEFDAQDRACPVVFDCDSASPSDHHVIDGICHMTCSGADGDTAVRHRQTAIDGDCVCRIVARHGCSPSLQEITDRGLLIRTNPLDRETLRALVADLGDVADTVQLRQLVVSTDEDGPRSELVDLESLTDTERETIDRAIVAGYYDRPRTVDFDDLADELDVSKSALSKRLTSAEAKIMCDLFHEGE
jgi:predicted DNA binding protein